MKPVKVGLVGAGPWAQMFHGPMLSAGPHCTLSVVWARRLEAASAVASQCGSSATDDFEQFLDECDAVAFAVPPDVQAQLAPRAAAASKPLLLEKPIALTLADARAMTAAIDAAGVPTQIVLSRRYSSRIRTFLEELRGLPVTGVRTSFVSGAFLPGSPFATAWRLQQGAVLDVGPHVLDLLDAAAGRIESISYVGDTHDWTAVTTIHHGGAIGQACISSVVPGELSDLAVFGPQGIRWAPPRDEGERDEVMARIAEEFAGVVRTGQSHELDVHRGLYLQELIQGR